MPAPGVAIALPSILSVGYSGIQVYAHICIYFAGGKDHMAKPKVLFLCTGNSARSQMAEGYLRHVAGDEFEPLSAGVEPKELNPLAVEAMREIGIDISQQKSKDVIGFLGQYIPYVVTVCDNAKQRCPI